MGAWGYGAFDNDTAGDWLDEKILPLLRKPIEAAARGERRHPIEVVHAALSMVKDLGLQRHFDDRDLVNAIDVVLGSDEFIEWKEPAARQDTVMALGEALVPWFDRAEALARLRGDDAAIHRVSVRRMPRVRSNPHGFEQYEFRVSSSFLPALLNGDTSNLSPQDEAALERFYKRVMPLGRGHWAVIEEDAGFGRDQITGLGSDRALIAWMVPKQRANPRRR